MLERGEEVEASFFRPSAAQHLAGCGERATFIRHLDEGRSVPTSSVACFCVASGALCFTQCSTIESSGFETQVDSCLSAIA